MAFVATCSLFEECCKHDMKWGNFVCDLFKTRLPSPVFEVSNAQWRTHQLLQPSQKWFLQHPLLEEKPPPNRHTANDHSRATCLLPPSAAKSKPKMDVQYSWPKFRPVQLHQLQYLYLFLDMALQNHYWKNTLIIKLYLRLVIKREFKLQIPTLFRHDV